MTESNQLLTEQLIEHLGLTGDPFEPELEMFYGGAQRQHNLETLRHMSTFGDMVLLLTGERGSGKTSLLKQFSQEAADDLNVYTVDVPAFLKQKDKSSSVISIFSAQLGLASVPGETTRQAFNRLVQAIQASFEESGHRTVLVFDGADLLAKKELQFYISSFAQLPKEGAVIAVFSGLPALLQIARLSFTESDDEWLHQIQLKPLGAAEVLEYLQQRLELVGFSGLLELSESQAEHLIGAGKGLPGRINRLFGSVLLEPGTLKIAPKSRTKVPVQVFLGLAGLLGFSFVLVAYQHGVFDSSPQAEEVVGTVLSQEAGGVELERQRKETLEAERVARLKLLDQALSESLPRKEGGESLPGAVASLKGKDLAFVEKGLDSSNPLDTGKGIVAIKADADSDTAGITSADASAGEQVQERSPSALHGSVEGERDTLIKVSENAPQNTRDIASNMSQLAVVSEVSAAKEQERKREKKQAKQQESQASVEQSKPYFHDRAWVSAQSPRAYSAQILGSYNESTAIKFVKRVGKVDHPVFYLETLYKGKPWFVVFYGVFPDKKVAIKALKSAPKDVASQQPWLRSFEGILKSYP